MLISEYKQHIHWLIKALGTLGISTNELAEYLNCQADNLPQCLPMADYLKLLEHCAQYFPQGNIGLEIGKVVSPHDAGILGYLALSSATLRDFFRAYGRYQSVLMTGMYWQFKEVNQAFEARYFINAPASLGSSIDAEITIASAVNFLSEQFNIDRNAIHMDFCHEPTSSLAEYQQLGQQIHFKQAHNRIRYPAHILETPLQHHDPQLNKILQQQVEKLMNENQQGHDFLQQTTLLITTALGSEQDDAQHICQQLNITTRTLNRRLQRFGYSYRTLKEELIFKIAKEMLLASDDNITTIGMNLGFSEVSAFVRAFKRHCNETPLQYRKQRCSQH